MNRQLGKNVLFNTVGSLTFYICQAAMNLLVTAIAGVEANGLLAVAMTIANVGLSFSSFGMRTFQVSDLNSKYADRTYLLSRYCTVLTAWVVCMGFAFLNSYSAEQRWIIFLYAGYRFVESFSDVWHGFLQKAERMDIVGISFGVRGLVTAACVVLGLLLTKSLIPTLAVLLALNFGYVLVVDIPLARRTADLKNTGGGSVAALLWECLPLAVYASLNTTIGSVPRYFCERILGSVALNYFANVFLPVMLLQVAAVYLFVPFITLFARLWNARDKSGYAKGIAALFAALAALWVCGAVGVLLLGRWGLGFLYPSIPEILNYTSLLQPLVVCTVLTVLATVLCNLLTIARCMRGLIIGNLAGLAAALLVSTPLIRAFDLWGTAFSTMSGIGVQCLFLLFFLFLQCRKQFCQ